MSIFFVEGNVGAGKSTLLDAIVGCKMPCVVVKEPVDEWSQPLDGGDGILQLYYKDKKEYGLSFQANVLMSRMTQLLTVIRDNPGAVIIAERSPSSGNIFARQLLLDDALTPLEFALHQRWVDMSESLIRTTGVVYLRVSPDVCMDRVRRRDRRGESDVDATLINDLHRLHETYIADVKTMGGNVLEINGDHEGGDNLQRIRAFMDV